MSHAEISDSTAMARGTVKSLSLADADFLVTPWGWAGFMRIGGWVVLRTRVSRR